jgi:LPXTG-motif cell wall-anchored protein
MKFSSFFVHAATATVVLLGSSSAVFAGAPAAPVVPEPSAILVWAGIAGVGGAAYWWRNRRQS